MPPLTVGKTTVPWELRFRKKSHLSISVVPGGSVIVNAPLNASIEDVLSRVRRRAPWIAKQRDFFNQFPDGPQEKRFISGETFDYLGRQYRLKIISSKIDSVEFMGKRLCVYAAPHSPSHKIRSLVQNWLVMCAALVFNQRLSRLSASMKTLGIPTPVLNVKSMKMRWGSCSSRGRVTLNINLIRTPVSCIDYVIIHELCHLRYNNHSPNFYRILSRILPDWQRRKERLDAFIV